jgi:hypothetical protein
MVHLRVNEREVHPNPHINYITPLTCADLQSQEDARQLLCALAAQVKPVMKSHGLSINSLEEARKTRFKILIRALTCRLAVRV